MEVVVIFTDEKERENRSKQWISCLDKPLSAAHCVQPHTAASSLLAQLENTDSHNREEERLFRSKCALPTPASFFVV